MRPRSAMTRGRSCGRSMLAPCFTPPLAVRHVTQIVAYDLHFLANTRSVRQMPIEFLWLNTPSWILTGLLCIDTILLGGVLIKGIREGRGHR